MVTHHTKYSCDGATSKRSGCHGFFCCIKIHWQEFYNFLKYITAQNLRIVPLR